ncbi:MarC family protein [Methanococcus sp. CF]
MDVHVIILAFTSLFSILNPFGVIPTYLILTSQYSKIEKIKIIRKSMLAAFAILMTFALLGNQILGFFGISIPAIKITGGVLLFLIALDMIQGNTSKVEKTPKLESHLKSHSEELDEMNEIAIVPLTVPLLTGPGSISAVIAMMAQSSDFDGKISVIIAISLCIIVSYFVLKFSKDLEKMLGKIGFKVLTKMMGLVLTAISIQMALDGILMVFG